MKKNCFFSLFLASIFLLAAFWLHPCLPDAQSWAAADQKQQKIDDWVSMPAGAKPAYMGIHGGTMPVSLLVSGDGESLFTFVGRTGNDFLEVLRKLYMPFPSFGNSTRAASGPARRLASDLFAGNATASMPVFALPGDRLAKEGWLAHLQPFGLSPQPLSIEGQIAIPPAASPSRKYRKLFIPDYFAPRAR